MISGSIAEVYVYEIPEAKKRGHRDTKYQTHTYKLSILIARFSVALCVSRA